ncbi:MAG: hypothetical protein CMO01_18535 [Thalassobius sp.]|nr:hypothetical protein [Thalassovita sp.]
MKVLFIKSILLMFAIGLLVQCSTDDGMFDDFVTDNLSTTIVIDTVTVKTYTTKLDSVVTSGTGEVLVGIYNKDKIGKFTASAYLEFGLPSGIDNIDLDDAYSFDSVVFVTTFDSYIGDTTELQRVEIKRLAEELDPPNEDNDYMLDYDEIAVEGRSLGEGNFPVKPTANVPVYIKLEDSFGETFFNMIRDDDELFDVEADFLDYFPGLAIMPVEGTANTLLGFGTETSTDEDTGTSTGNEPYIRIYYSIHSAEFPSRDSIDFPLTSSSYHYTRVEFEAEKDLIGELESEEDKVSSTLTDDETYISGIIGLSTRIEFPYLQTMREDIGEQGYILGAKLILQPVQGTYRYEDDLPGSLEMYVINEDNILESQVYEPYTSDVQYGSYYFDGEFYEDTQYAYDLTEYFTETGIYDEGEGFLLTVPRSGLANNFKSVIFPSPNTQSEDANVYLELYYVFVDP